MYILIRETSLLKQLAQITIFILNIGNIKNKHVNKCILLLYECLNKQKKKIKLSKSKGKSSQKNVANLYNMEIKFTVFFL